MRVYVDPITWEEAEALKAATLDYFNSTGNYGPYMLMVNGLHSAFRFKDLNRIRWSSYEFNGDQSGKIVLKESKTGKSREVVMSPAYVSAVKFIMNAIGVDGTCDDFVHIKASNRKVKDPPPITYNGAKKWIKQWCAHIGVDHNVSLHSLRKAWALHAYNKMERSEYGLQVISTALNHSDTATTRTYIGLSLNSKAVNSLYSLI